MLPNNCFYGIPECVNEWVSMCLLFGSFPSVLSNSNVLVFVLSYFIIIP